MPTLVSRHRGESAAERKHQPRCNGRTGSRAREVETIRLTQSIDVLHLVGAKRGHDLVTRPSGRRLECRWSFRPKPRRRLEHPYEQAGPPRVGIGPFAVLPLTDRIGDSFIEDRQVQACGHVEVVDALRDGPPISGPARRRFRDDGMPRELRIVERRNECIRIVGELLELTPELVELWRERKVRRCGHGRDSIKCSRVERGALIAVSVRVQIRTTPH